MIFAISVGRHYLDLDPRVRITLRRNNPVFGDQAPEGEFSMPLTLPPTDHNMRTLGLLNHRLTLKDWSTKECQAHMLGGMWKQGRLHFRRSTLRGGPIQAVLLIGTSAMAELLKNTRVRDIGAPTTALGADQAARLATLKSLSTTGTQVSFPVIANDGLVEEDFPGYQGRVNDYDPVAGAYLDTQLERSKTGFSTYLNRAFQPAFHLRWVFDQIAEFLDMSLAGDFVDISDFNKVPIHSSDLLADVSYANADYDWELSSTVSLTGLNGSYLDKAPVIFLSRPTTVNSEGAHVFKVLGQEDVAAIDQLPGRHEIDWDIKVDGINLTEWSVSIGYEVVEGTDVVISEYQAITTQGSGTTYHFDIDYDSSDWDDHEVWFYVKFTRLSGTSDMDIDFLEFQAVHSFLDSENYPILQLPATLDPADHLPTASLSDWLTAVAHDFGLMYTYNLDDRIWQVDLVSDRITTPCPKILEEKTIAAGIEYRPHYLTFGFEQDSEDELTQTTEFLTLFSDRTSGDPSHSAKDYRSQLGTALITEIALAGGRYWEVATMKRRGSIPALDQDPATDFGVVLISHGFTADTGGSAQTAPVAHYRRTNSQGTEATYFSLEWQQADGLFQFWSAFADMLVAGELYSFEHYWDRLEISTIEPTDVFAYRGQRLFFADHRLQLSLDAVGKLASKAWLLPTT